MYTFAKKKTMYAIFTIRVCLLFVAVNFSLFFSESSSDGSCHGNDRQALLQFRQDLQDPSSSLASWVDDSDCCEWFGVDCHNTTGDVLELHLGLSSCDYDDAFTRLTLSGKINPSLLNLTHLRYLDLSCNDFSGTSFPEFFGSMKSLRILNLSEAGFQGMVPHQLGNLSNLRYLNLRGSELYAENMHWLSGLSSLQFLDLSGMFLGDAIDWLEVMSSLPSLMELYLSNCALPFDPSPLHVNFSSLSILDLSENFFGPSLLKWIPSIKTLTSLNLAHNEFQGSISSQLQNLTSVKKLDLSWNYYNSSIPNWLYSMHQLELLNLRGNHFQGNVSSVISNMTSLVSLDLSWNQLEGGIPATFKKLCNLKTLFLDSNHMSQKLDEVIEILSGCIADGLEFLVLSKFGGTGSVPTSLCEFATLKGLYLSGNNLKGGLPACFGSLDRLEAIDLRNNSISGPIPTSLCKFTGLSYLDLSVNELNGNLPACFGNLTKLEIADLWSNSISGPIPTSFGELTSLSRLDLSNNKLNGTLPESFGELSNIEYLSVKGNLLEGIVSEVHFANLTKLKVFSADGNRLILRVNPKWVPPPKLFVLSLRSWQAVGPPFPKWLCSRHHIQYLDLSNTGIVSKIPSCFWNISSGLKYLNLSHNHIHGMLSNLHMLDSNYGNIDLSSNLLEGPLPHISSNIFALDLSNNSFAGSMLHFLCFQKDEPKLLQVLNLGDNHLSGNIPDCWRSWESMMALKLSGNRFNGSIPGSIGTLSYLQFLHLRNNNLSGEIPLSLQNCTEMITLDLSENHFIGSIPRWIGSKMHQMIILNLRKNRYSGHVPEEICDATKLHILDLAYNNLSGSIPRCISRFTAMARRNEPYGQIGSVYNSTGGGEFLDSSSHQMKGQMAEYSTILRFVKSIDLSSNRISGIIPDEITTLKGLQSLNLSNNVLSGEIPDDIGTMKSLEAIDLSQNQLSGDIPQSMSSLTFLSYLNLSFNDLQGRIPSSTQLQGFNASSFTGNKLCGLPLMKNCGSNNDEMPSRKNHANEDGDRHEFNWIWLSSALGFIVGFWSVIGPLCFIRSWRYTYFQFLEDLWYGLSYKIRRS